MLLLFLMQAIITMNLPLDTAFAASRTFWYAVFLFSLASRYFLNTLGISP